MKNRFFPSLSVSLILTISIFSLQSCAFLELDSERENLADYDRGYSQDDDLEEEVKANTETARRRASAHDEDSDTSSELSYEQRRVKRAIETRDVVLGMTRHEVMESWGEPTQREVAGRGKGGHERWVFGSRFSLDGSRTVIFENGRVAGWGH